MAQYDLHVLRGDATIDEINALISQATDEPHMAFGLSAAKAAAQKTSGDRVGAAATLQYMAALVEKHPESLDTELYALHLEAAELLSEAQALEASRDAYFAALAALTSSADNIELQNRITKAAADISVRLGEISFADNLVESTDEISQFTAPPKPPPKPGDPGFVRIPVYYATDRSQSGKDWPAQFYADVQGAQLEYGVAMVTVPRTVTPDALPGPSIWEVEFSSEPARQTIMQSVTQINRREFFNTVRSQLQAKQVPDILVYVPGRAETFSDAARHAAKLTEALRFVGVPLLFSWPSSSLPTGYLADSAAAEASATNLAVFLTELAASSEARTVHLLAHGLGSATLSSALGNIAKVADETAVPALGQVIFASPDVEKERFAQSLVKARGLAKRITVYVSDQDRTLTDVQPLFIFGTRAGDTLAPLQGDIFDTIDISVLGSDPLTGTVNVGEPSAILDIASLLWADPDPARRCGITTNFEADKIWSLGPATCASPSTVNAIANLAKADARLPGSIRENLAREGLKHPKLSQIELLLLNMAVRN